VFIVKKKVKIQMNLRKITKYVAISLAVRLNTAMWVAEAVMLALGIVMKPIKIEEAWSTMAQKWEKYVDKWKRWLASEVGSSCMIELRETIRPP
jgi:hypothetical protein